MPHQQYPRLLPQSALGAPLARLEVPLRTHITTTLQLVPVETTRVFQALCNYNLLAHAINEDRQYINRLLRNASARDLTRLGEQFSRAIIQCKTSIPLIVRNTLAQISLGQAVGGGGGGSSSSGIATSRSTWALNMVRPPRTSSLTQGILANT